MPKDPYQYFRVEAKEIVEQLSRGVLDLEQGISGKDAIAALLRLAHTLKGAAHVVKQATIGRLAHELEDALLPFAGGQPAPRENAAGMLQMVDAIAAELVSLNGEPAKAPEAAVPPPIDDVFDTVRVDIRDMDMLLEEVAEAGVHTAGVRGKLEVLEQAAGLATVLSHQLASPALEDTTGRGARPLAKARRLAEDLEALLQPLRRNLSAGLEQVERELTHVRGISNRLRLIPASAVFAPLRRAARNTAETLGKQVEFEADGGEHRLDAYVLAAVRDALLHVVRNAVAHGIESPAERIAAGKTAAGRVNLHVERHGHRVAFSCRDDGRGFDLGALRQAVVARNLVSRREAEILRQDEIFRLILSGGISTSGTVTEVSGRGIGLDVVRETASKLKAEVTISTDPGRGATVQIAVPVSLLSLAAVIAESGEISAALPLDSVRQAVRLSAEDVVHNPENDAIVFEGRMVPFLSLAHVLRQSAPRQRAQPRFSSAVVVRYGTELAAIGVERLRGTTTVLLRPIPPFAGVDSVIAGAALDAEGNPRLVLDPAALVLAARTSRTAAAKPAAPRTPLVLVIDDSLTTRMLEKSILESAGYEVDLATSGEEAMEKARARHYDLFVVDVEMPGMDGFDFVTRARSDPALSGVPSILVTSRSSQADRRRGDEAGARAYIVKSEFDQGALLQVIQQLVI